MQQQGGSQYGVPPLEMVPQFSSSGAGGQRQSRMIGIHGGADHLQHQPPAEAASPISSRSAPQSHALMSRSPATLFDELGGGGASAAAAAKGFADEEALGAGDEGERGGGVGSRWPRQETLALLKIRSEMDVAFRDATLKGPLWEDVSRKLSELGYTRSAKKCKEKFENVHKYYKRTKEGRAGRQDGKSYRFFSQLEALHSTPTAPNINSLPPLTSDPSAPTAAAAAAPMAAPPADRLLLEPPPPPAQLTALAPAAGISFSSNTSSSSSSSDSDGEDTDEAAGALQDGGSRKRKRDDVGWPCGSGKTMAFFEGLMKQLMERQEAMQKRFLDTIEKREQDRMAREDAWKRQEMARLNREYDLMAQERTMTANRDAAVISFLHKFAGGSGVANSPNNPMLEAAAISAPVAPDPSSVEEAPQQQEDRPESRRSQLQGNHEIVIHQPSVSSEAVAAVEAAAEGMAGGCLDMVPLSSSSKSSASSRWPKAEVLALIKLRSGLEARYLEAGPKGPLWEEISMGMKRLGYNRSTKRCKEKWENINKYFKKVKEGNKKRPEDAKTCPYFHELDALYRRKQQQETATNPAPQISVPAEQENNSGGHKNATTTRSNIGNGGNHEGGGFQLPRSNANGLSQVFFGGAPNSGSDAALKKPEDIVKELMEQQNHEEEEEEEDVDDDDYDDDDDDEDGNMRYEIQFQRQQSVGAAGGSRGGNAAGKAPASAPPSSNAGSFLAMVQ